MKRLLALSSTLAVGILLFGMFATRPVRSTQAAGPSTLSISATGLTVTLAASGAGVDPYTGYNYGLSYDPTLLSFASRANALPGGPFCVDNGGADSVAIVGCTLLSGTSTYSGDLGSITFTAAGPSGCATLQITAYDGSNADTGTYLLDPSSNPVSNPLGIAQVQIPVNGGSCVGTATPTPSPTITPSPTNTATPTATATPSATPISGAPDVTVFMNASPPTSSSGGGIAYVLTVKNIGDATATGVTLSVTLAPGSVKSGGGPCPAFLSGHYVCPVSNLAPNDHALGGPDEAVITVNARAPFTTHDVTISASVIAAAANEPVAATGNNTSSAMVSVGGCPDLNDDGAITINDFAKAALSFGLSMGDPGYNPLADQNGDNTITIADLGLMAPHFATACRGIDADQDGLSDHEETTVYLTNPANADTDGDGLPDGVEVLSFGTSPTNPDTDNDGYTDNQEVVIAKAPTIYCAIMRADVTNDGIITINDLGHIATDYSKPIPPGHARYDQNFDNLISINDLAKVALVYSLPVTACP